MAEAGPSECGERPYSRLGENLPSRLKLSLWAPAVSPCLFCFDLRNEQRMIVFAILRWPTPTHSQAAQMRERHLHAQQKRQAGDGNLDLMVQELGTNWADQFPPVYRRVTSSETGDY